MKRLNKEVVIDDEDIDVLKLVITGINQTTYERANNFISFDHLAFYRTFHFSQEITVLIFRSSTYQM